MEFPGGLVPSTGVAPKALFRRAGGRVPGKAFRLCSPQLPRGSSGCTLHAGFRGSCKD